MDKEPENESVEQKERHGSPLILFPEIIGFFALPFLLFKEVLTGNPLIGSVGLVLWFFGLLFLLVCISRRRYYLAGLQMLVIFGLYFLAHKMLGS